jgi:hypothetical protein
MGLFGGKSEEELRASGTPTTARVTYVDDTGKRREDGGQAKVKVRVRIDSGSARGRELEKTKWVPVGLLPHVGDTVQIRYEPDQFDDWAWGDAAMYAPAATAAAPEVQPVPVPPAAVTPWAGSAQVQGGVFDMSQIQQMIATAFEQANVTIEQSSHVIDATGDPALRAQIMDTLRAHGVDIDAVQAAQPAQPAALGGPAATPSADDLGDRLRRVDELLEQGLLTADEHREQRRRIIDSI